LKKKHKIPPVSSDEEAGPGCCLKMGRHVKG